MHAYAQKVRIYSVRGVVRRLERAFINAEVLSGSQAGTGTGDPLQGNGGDRAKQVGCPHRP